MNLEYFFIGIILISIICMAFLLGMLAEAKMSEADLQEIKPKTKSKEVDSVEK